MKFPRPLYIILLMILLFSVSSVFAVTDYLAVLVSDDGIESVVPYQYNEYYRQKFYYGAIDNVDTSNLGIYLEDELTGEIIYPRFADSEYIIFRDIDSESDYSLKFATISKPISFCNDDGVCDSCNDASCNNYENYKNCPNDCPSGSDDNYCDLQPDYICDQDCPSYDFDCEECSECVFEGQFEQRDYCADLGGIGCRVGMACDGNFVYSYDYGSYCCIGSCYDPLDLRIKEIKEKEKLFDFLEDPTSVDSSPDADDLIEEKESEFDFQLFIYIIIIIILLFVAVVLVAVFESHEIKREHEVRAYVYSLMKQGYSYDQVYNSLVQQNIEKNIVEKVMRQYQK